MVGIVLMCCSKLCGYAPFARAKIWLGTGFMKVLLVSMLYLLVGAWGLEPQTSAVSRQRSTN